MVATSRYRLEDEAHHHGEGKDEEQEGEMLDGEGWRFVIVCRGRVIISQGRLVVRRMIVRHFGNPTGVPLAALALVDRLKIKSKIQLTRDYSSSMKRRIFLWPPASVDPAPLFYGPRRPGRLRRRSLVRRCHYPSPLHRFEGWHLVL